MHATLHHLFYCAPGSLQENLPTIGQSDLIHCSCMFTRMDIAHIISLCGKAGACQGNLHGSAQRYAKAIVTRLFHSNKLW